MASYDTASDDDESTLNTAQDARAGQPRSSQTVADVAIFEDEELYHTLEPSFLGTLSTLDVVLAVCTGGFWLLVPYFRSRNTAYIITSDRLIDKQGSLTGHTTEEIRFDDIVGDIRSSQGLLEGLLDRGTIRFEIEKQRRTTASERESTERTSARSEMDIERQEIELNGIKNHSEVTNTIRRIAHS